MVAARKERARRPFDKFRRPGSKGWGNAGRLIAAPRVDHSAATVRGSEGSPAVALSSSSRKAGRFSASTVATSVAERSEEHTSELQSLMRNSYAVFCLKKKK